MENKRPIIPPKETKEYLAKNDIPQLFECLMTGLMYHRPIDPLQYLQECIEKIKRQGPQNVRWDLFLETKRSCLPPLTHKRAAEGFSKYEPLPGIDSLRLKMRPQTSVICILAGPGIDKGGFAEKMLTHYPSFIHINMGDLAKNCARIEERKPSSRFQNAHAFIQAGDFAPEEMIFELLIWNLNQYPGSSGFIIDGYPRTFQQYEDLKTHVGLERLAAVVLIDAPEEKCLQRLMNADQTNDPVDMIQSASVIRRRLCNFKNLTLPMCKTIDDDNKLRVIDGDMKDDHIAREMLTIFEFVLSGKVTGPATRPEPGTIPDAPVNRTMEKIGGCMGNPRAFDIARITPEFKDCGRRPHLPKCPILVLLGGPGSGRTKQALALCSMIPGVKHFNITDLLRTKVLDSLVGGAQKDWDVVAKRVHSSEPPLEYDRLIPEYWDIQVDILREEFIKLANTASMVIIEGYLNDESQIITFNQNIGGADLIVLLDCEESTLNQRLSKRGARIRRVEDEGHIISQRINFFKQVTLPVVRYFDELGKLVIVPADREADLVTKDLVYLIEYFLAKGRRQANNSAHVDVPLMQNNSNCALEDAATTIQATFRGYLCRKGIQQEKRMNRSLDHGSNYALDKDSAATTIQANFRAYLCRKEMKQEKRMNRSLDHSSNFAPDKDGAARKIQANFRGYLCRKEIQQVGSQQDHKAKKSELRNRARKSDSDVQFFFLLAPPGFKKNALAKQLADQQNLYLIKLKDWAYPKEAKDKMFQRLEVIVKKVAKEQTRFLMDGFPMDFEKFSEFKQQITKNLHILFLDVNYSTAQQKYHENSQLPEEENALVNARFLSKLSHFYDEAMVLTEVLDSQTMFHKVNGNMDDQAILKELSNYVGQAGK